MYTVNRSAILPYSSLQLYLLVTDIEAYPSFLPWCDKANVISKHQLDDGEEIVANLGIHFSGIKQSFTTKNRNCPCKTVEMKLVEGPFSHLKGTWTFTELNDDACKIELNMDFDFSNWLLRKMVAPVFGKICENFIEAFRNRAEEVYGKKPLSV